MTKVVAEITMSLDGYAAGPNDSKENPLGDGGQGLHAWMFGGSTPSRHAEFFRPDEGSQDVFDEMVETTGSSITGRRTYDFTDGWGGDHPFHIPFIVVTHRAPDQPAGGSRSMATFVTDGIEHAVAEAKSVAGTKNVVVGTPSITDQALHAGLLDEVHIHQIPILLGGGVPVFRQLGSGPIELERIKTVEAKGVTHLYLRVVK